MSLWQPARRIAAALNQPPRAGDLRKARITAIEVVGPPAVVTVRIEDRWEVPGVPVADHIDTPAVDDDVWVQRTADGDRIVIARH